MPLNRFEKLRRLIHFVSEEDASDKYATIRPVLNRIQKNCSSIQQEHQQSIDKTMKPYKGTRAGYIFATTFTEEEEDLGLGAKVVIALCKTPEQPEQRVVYFDNFFCSLELLRDSGITAVKWLDMKPEHIASTSTAREPLGNVKRYVKDETKMAAPAPRVILEYNSHMDGVDLADMLVELYRTPLKSRRYYLKQLGQLLDICVNNAWLLSRRDAQLHGASQTMPLKGFRAIVAKALLSENKKKRGRPSSDGQPSKRSRRPKVPRPQNGIRFDGVLKKEVYGSVYQT
ncbi:piggyBac transposable element-derived protein 3-like [Ixodes scapularis]|uniref:piggyBac transposable element-derived protein 3-like n=1 Tax=Ixodes scapularis TaxID=6945 RepID=UPI001A9F6FE1|nr:piggyBac transposable element-derived protein 3-like [Ixodes scapularis]